jgi:hypothetical protein
MPLIFKHETLMRDPYYRKGVEDSKKETIKNVINLNILTPEQIATALNVATSYILEIIEEEKIKNQI